MSLIISGIGVTAFSIFHMLFRLRPQKEHKANGHTTGNGTSALVSELEGGQGEAIKAVKSKIIHFLQMPLLYQTSLL